MADFLLFVGQVDKIKSFFFFYLARSDKLDNNGCSLNGSASAFGPGILLQQSIYIYIYILGR